MFTSGQFIFAGLFFLAFVAIIVWSYRKDIKVHQKYYKNSYLVLIALVLFFSLLFAIKTVLYS